MASPTLAGVVTLASEEHLVPHAAKVLNEVAEPCRPRKFDFRAEMNARGGVQAMDLPFDIDTEAGAVAAFALPADIQPLAQATARMLHIPLDVASSLRSVLLSCSPNLVAMLEEAPTFLLAELARHVYAIATQDRSVAISYCRDKLAVVCAEFSDGRFPYYRAFKALTEGFVTVLSPMTYDILWGMFVPRRSVSDPGFDRSKALSELDLMRHAMRTCLAEGTGPELVQGEMWSRFFKLIDPLLLNDPQR